VRAGTDEEVTVTLEYERKVFGPIAGKAPIKVGPATASTN
jgi:hypothetical protein